MRVRFWGVRGSIAVCGADFAATGGNTSCVEVEHDGVRLILDGGTGLQALGRHIGTPAEVAILFSHVHWDHIQGVPFFGPLFHPASKVRILGASRDSGTIRDALAAQMRPPTFPVGLDVFRAQLRFTDLRSGVALEHGPFRITPLDLEHPDGVFAYRLDAGGRSLVYATDVEHGTAIDRRLIALSEGADLVIHDAQYHQHEYRGERGPSRVGWGHSAWDQAADLAHQARASRLALFHHDPGRTDAQVREIETLAAGVLPQSFAAREGQELCW